jgi:hypothetical protein
MVDFPQSVNASTPASSAPPSVDFSCTGLTSAGALQQAPYQGPINSPVDQDIDLSLLRANMRSVHAAQCATFQSGAVMPVAVNPERDTLRSRSDDILAELLTDPPEAEA